MNIELARALAYEHLQDFLLGSFAKERFPSTYSRDWILCREIISSEGTLYDTASVLQKQAARLLNMLLDMQSTEEVFGLNSQPFQSSEVDAIKELELLERLIAGASLTVEKEQGKGRRNTQIEIIMQVIKELGYDPQKIPDKGKAEIRERCERRNLALFSKDSFDHAWKFGNREALFSIVDKKRFI